MTTMKSIDCYEISLVKPKTRLNQLDVMIENLRDLIPDYEGVQIDNYTIVGLAGGHQRFVAKKDDKYYTIKLKNKTGVPVVRNSRPIIEKDLTQMNLKTKRLRDVHFDPSLFIPMESGTALDHCFSGDRDHPNGGILPATNYIVIGDPGIGKSSVTIEYAAAVQEKNPNKKVLFISGEMTEMDMIPYTKRFPKWLDIETLFVTDLTEELYKESIEAKLEEGFDLVLGDSFAEIADAVRGDYNLTVSGSDKMTYNDVEKWLVDLMIKNNKAENQENKHTAFIFIQQMTKGGDFVGSNKLKHNTTGMLELRYNKAGDRIIIVSKNRRGFEYNNLRFEFTTDINEPIFYDVERIMRDKRVEEEIKKVAQEQLNNEKETDDWFANLGQQDEEFTEVEEFSL